MTDHDRKCFLCETTDAELPLVRLDFRGEGIAICPRHLPVLIHQTENALARLRPPEPPPPT